jgi:hypothetical protein
MTPPRRAPRGDPPLKGRDGNIALGRSNPSPERGGWRRPRSGRSRVGRTSEKDCSCRPSSSSGPRKSRRRACSTSAPRCPCATSRACSEYRAAHNGPDLFGNPAGLSERDTVAVVELDGKPVFGTNSEALTYSNADRVAAKRFVDVMVEKYPTTMNVGNIGGMPNNSLYHAESTLLLRAARENGGSLAGKTLEVHVDRILCYSCEAVLPKLGAELGNPTVTFVTPQHIHVMQNGTWVSKARR